MNNYSRINSKGKSQPRDSSDLSFPVSSQVSRLPHVEKTNKNEFSEKAKHFESGEEENGGEMFGVLLSRSRSVPFSTSMAEKESRSIQPEEKTACNYVKRSSSVSSAVSYSRIHHPGGYSRIHHQISDEEETENLNFLHRKQGKKDKGGKILRACMRLLGIN